MGGAKEIKRFLTLEFETVIFGVSLFGIGQNKWSPMDTEPSRIEFKPTEMVKWDRLIPISKCKQVSIHLCEWLVNLSHCFCVECFMRQQVPES